MLHAWATETHHLRCYIVHMHLFSADPLAYPSTPLTPCIAFKLSCRLFQMRFPDSLHSTGCGAQAVRELQHH